MGEYLTRTTTELYTSTGWFDVSSYVVTDLEGELGFYNISPDNRIASIGNLKFSLNNASGLFTSGTYTRKGTIVKVTSFYGEPAIKFFGYVEMAKPDEGIWGNQRVEVTAVDWFGYSTKFLLRAKTAESSKKIDQAVTSLLSIMPKVPNERDFDTGDETFTTVFDGSGGVPSAFSELNNLVMSELGYIYAKDGGNTLKVEAFSSRTGLNDLDVFQFTSNVEAGFALNDAGDGFLLGDAGGKILLSSASTSIVTGSFDRTYYDLEINDGDNVLNDITVSAYPRDYDPSPTSLYDLYTYNLYASVPAIPIPALGTITLKGGYTETYGGKSIASAINVRTPDPTLGSPDYIFTLNSDGTGTNLASNISGTFVGGATSWTWKLTNNGQMGYLYYFTIVGQPVFKNNPIESPNVDEASQDAYGDSPLYIAQPYQQDTENGVQEALKIIDDNRKPRTYPLRAKFHANASAENMAGFMFADIGSLVNIKSTKPAIDTDFYIQGIRYKISVSGIVDYEWILKEANSFRKGLTPLALKYSGVASSKNVVTFLPSSKTSNLSTKSISAWVYGKSTAADVPIVSKYDQKAGHQLYWFTGNGMVQYLHAFSGTFGIWRIPTTSVLTGTWTNVIMTYDSSSAANDPIIYVNGVSKTITEIQAPVGTSLDDSNVAIDIGNLNRPGSLLTFDYNGLIKDVRYYNRILTAAEALTIANSPNNYYSVTSGLVFSMGGCRTDRYTDYLNNPITTEMKIAENIYGFRGTASYASVANGQLKGADPTLSSY